MTDSPITRPAPSSAVSPVIVGGVDTHKDLHVAAIVDAADKVVATEFFSTTRAGYRAMLRWMRSHGDLARIGVECTGSYGAGLLRFLDNAGLEVLEVTAPDNPIGAGAARTTPSTPRTLPTRRSPRSEPSHRKPVTGWSSRYGFCRSPARLPSVPAGSRSR
nr:hypothetical protein GCM10017611_14170 [Rhodococcus wratislaviensis]